MEYTIDSSYNLRDFFASIDDNEITVYFKEGIYFSLGDETDCLKIKNAHVTLIGLGDVTIYDNRGHMMGCHPVLGNTSSLAHTLLFLGETIYLENITIVNGVSIDYIYKNINYKKRSEVITQGYALGVWNGQSVIANKCKFISMLDTLDIKNTNNLKFENCFLQGNNDFIGVASKTYYYKTTFDLIGPSPIFQAADTYLLFNECHFNVVTCLKKICLTKRGGDIILLNNEFTCNHEVSFQMERNPSEISRYFLFNNTLNNSPFNPIGYEESFVHLNEKQCHYILNNLDRNLFIKVIGPKEVSREALYTLSGDLNDLTITVSTNIDYQVIENKIYLKNTLVGEDQVGFIKVNNNFYESIIYFKQIGLKIGYPEMIKPLTCKILDNKLIVDYEISGNDISLIEVLYDNSILYRSRGLKSFPIERSDYNKKLLVILRPENTVSLVSSPIKKEVLIDKLPNHIIYDRLDVLVLKEFNHLHMKNIEALYLGEEVPNYVKFEKGSDECFKYLNGEDGALNRQGLVTVERGAGLIYPDNTETDKYKLSIRLALEKQTGEGFGSPNGQYLELWMNYDQTDGIALRIERENTSNKSCYLSIREYHNNVNKLVSEKISTNAFNKVVNITAILLNGLLQFKVENGIYSSILSYKIDKLKTAFLLRHTGTVSIGNRVLIERIEIGG